MSARCEPETSRSPAAQGGATRGDRVESVLVLLLAGATLAIAAVLRPEDAGFGTHTQLIPVPCIFRWLTGLPCPACGMSTALAHMARGEVLAALRCHLLGPAAYVGAWLALGRSAWALVLGTPLMPAWLRGARAAKVVLAVIAVAWLANIVMALAS